MSTADEHRHDPERVIDLDLVRCTENAALAGWKHFGKGDKIAADAAATDAIRGMFELIDCQGLVRILVKPLACASRLVWVLKRRLVKQRNITLGKESAL